MKPFDFLILEKLIAADTVNETALALGANRQQVMRWRARGLDDDEARELAERAGFEPADVWPELKNGKAAPTPRPDRVAVTEKIRQPEKPARLPAEAASDDVLWCDPPALRATTETVWIERLAPLIDRPGSWARIAVRAKPQAAYNAVTVLRRAVQQQDRKKVPAGRWEFAGRPLPDDPKRGGVWARYLGPDE